jgi:MFS family permease
VALLQRTTLVQAAVALALVFVTDSVAAIVVLATLLGCGHAIAQTAEFALVPSIASGPGLARLNGAVETARYVGMTLGPLVGGALAAVGEHELALAGNAVSFLAVAAAVHRLSVRRHPRERRHELGATRTQGGFSLLYAGELGTVVGVAVGSLVLMTTVWAAEPFFAREDLGAGDFGYGALAASWTVGMAAGASLVAPRIRRSLAVVAMLAIIGQGAGLALATIWLSLPIACTMFVFGGVAHGIKNVALRTLIHQRVAPASHGRAAAAYNASRNAAELIALIAGGTLVTAIGARATMALSGTLPMIAAAIGLALLAARAARGRGVGFQRGLPRRWRST